MSLETSSKVLKVTGIISIVLGVFGIIFGILAVAGGGVIGLGAAEAGEATQETSALFGLAVLGGLIFLLTGVIALIEGICSVRAANDHSKIMPAWIFALISLVMSVFSIVSPLVTGQQAAAAQNSAASATGTIIGTIIGLALNVLVFISANTIKKAVGK